MKHSRKVTSCQTCLGVFVQSLYLINEHLTYNLCYHVLYYSIKNLAAVSEIPLKTYRALNITFFKKVVANVWPGRPNLPYQASGPQSYLQMNLQACFFLSRSLLASLFFIWPKAQVFFFFFFCLALQHVGSQFPNQGLNPCPLHWKLRVLTSGLPGKSPRSFILIIHYQVPLSCPLFLYPCYAKPQPRLTQAFPSAPVSQADYC